MIAPLSVSFRAGRHFLQIPGPSNVPDRILRAMNRATIDHRGPEFARLGAECLEGMKTIFRTEDNGHVFIYPAGGTGAWEASIVNTLNTGDRVLMFETGHFATLWRRIAEKFGLNVDFVKGDWRHGISAATVEAKLRDDPSHAIKAVMCVHTETSTGITSNIAEVRRAMDAVHHPALLMVDAVSSLATCAFRQKEWGVDVAIAASQKGLMLPPGLGFNAVSAKALGASQHARMPRSYWSWDDMLAFNDKGFFPYTPATGLLYGLRESIRMLVHEEGLAHVFQRHQRLAEAAREAVGAWGLELLAEDPREFSSVVTAVMLPGGCDEAEFRRVVLNNFDLSLGAGLGRLAGKVFRIGHLGDFNDLMLCGTLCGVEMGLAKFGLPPKESGVVAAMAVLAKVPSAVASGAA
ncbi:MAG: serine--glyoxylate aminotransferase [Verrucomicrobia bacterium]|nr:serine--glyoxylate aminotransferase [Verrucomicrobiota bacterium]